MAKSLQTRQLLSDLLEGNVPNEASLVTLLADPPDEDQWLDYKAGAIMADPKRAARVVREYISGFANAEGGTLILGFDHSKGTTDGLKAPGTASLHDWAVSALAPLPALHAPRILSANVKGDDVLLLAVSRSRSLIYTIEEGAPVYYFRFGDSTREAPSYLIADLMLGRRTEPELRAYVTGVAVSMAPVRGVVLSPQISCSTFNLTIRYSNLGLQFAEGVRGGIVGPALSQAEVPSALARMVEFGSLPASWAVGDPAPSWKYWHRSDRAQTQNPGRTLAPFESAGDNIGNWVMPVFSNLTSSGLPREAVGRPDASAHLRGALEVQAGLYVLAKGGEPWWHQLTIQYDLTSLQIQAETHKLFRVEPLGHERPRVAVRFLPESWKMEDWKP